MEILYQYLIVALLGIMPISEARGAVIYGLGMGLNPALTFALAVVVNILPIPAIFWLLEKAHFHQIIRKLFGRRTDELVEKHRNHIALYEELGLLAFTAIPLPFTGSYSAALVASALGLNKKKSFIVISIGVVIGAALIFIGTESILFFLN